SSAERFAEPSWLRRKALSTSSRVIVRPSTVAQVSGETFWAGAGFELQAVSAAARPKVTSAGTNRERTLGDVGRELRICIPAEYSKSGRMSQRTARGAVVRPLFGP